MGNTLLNWEACGELERHEKLFDRQKSNNFLYLQVKIYGLGSDLWLNPKQFYSYFSKAVVEVKFISKYSGVIHSFHEEKMSSTFWYPFGIRS
jgi:hypothetical protein